MIKFDDTPFSGGDYSIKRPDLSVKKDGVPEEYGELFELFTVDDEADYEAHPDSVLLKNGDIFTAFPEGHGKGAIKVRISHDGGRTWVAKKENIPSSWKNSRETPTVYRLEFNGSKCDRLLLISGNPDWHDGVGTTGGFNCSLSDDEGETWSEFELFYGIGSEYPVVPIVSMASLTRLKENGEFVDKWMAFFHDSDFYNYKTVLSFDENGRMNWSKPEKYFSAHREEEKRANMCEVEVIRSDGGKGDTLCLLSRSNTKKVNSFISFSYDEGKTWTSPTETVPALNGERHKAEWTADGRLFITFRSIERGSKAKEFAGEDSGRGWISEGWCAWIGTFEDLLNNNEGQYRVKLAHIYLPGQTEPQYKANPDTGYCGLTVLPDGTVMTCTYGMFSPDNKCADGKELKTYICAKRIDLNALDNYARTVE